MTLNVLLDLLVIKSAHFSLFDYVVMALNVCVLLFSSKILGLHGITMDKKMHAKRVKGLRLVSLALLLAYSLPLLLEAESEIAHQISGSALTIFLFYILNNILHAWILREYGRTKDIEGKEVRSETLTSQTIHLVLLIILISFALLVLLNIWNLKSWLQTTSVIGGLLIGIFATKDYWLGDAIAGLINRGRTLFNRER